MADWDTFELFPVQMGSGPSQRISMHVAVRMYSRPSGYEDHPNLICLTAEADDPQELDAYIDELIGELQQLKQVARRKWGK